MTGKMKKPSAILDMSFGEALERFAKTDRKELEQMYRDVKRAEEENREFIEEREANIKNGARTARKRFRL